MKTFAQLYERLDSSTSTLDKVAAMVDYFRSAPPDDAAWTVYLLTGQKLRRVVTAPQLKQWALDATGLSEWLFVESYAIVGDLAETIALLVDSTGRDDLTCGRPTPPMFSDAQENATNPGCSVVGATGGRPGANASASVEIRSNTGNPSVGATGGRPGTNAPVDSNTPLHQWMTRLLPDLRRCAEDEQRTLVLRYWAGLRGTELFVFNKLLTGGMRVGVARTLVERALAEALAIERPVIAHRLMGSWEPNAAFMQGLAAPALEAAADPSRPYPFHLAYPLEDDPTSLGPVSDWQLEWKWDGIRGQLLRRDGQTFLWTRGEELVTDRYPEITAAAAHLPDGTVMDGEIIGWSGDRPLPFQELQKRIGRKVVSASLLRDCPCVLLAYDLLELDGVDQRGRPLRQRRQQLERLVQSADTPALRLPPLVMASDWADAAAQREGSREQLAEGLMLKHRDSVYETGRRKGAWWKWKVEPMTIDAVLIYAQAGHGRRANLYTDYTFAVWNEGELTPVAKAYSGLNDAEIRELDAWIRKHTRERFGPVRSVEAEQVFELGFEGIGASPRHKSGVAVRFPRILRWRHDKKAADADTLQTLKAFIRE